MESRISKIFDKLKKENKKAFISFCTGCFPDYETSLEINKAIVDAGVSIHEIGFAHAEAQGDGPAIQLANIEALKNQGTLEKTIKLASEIRKHNAEVGLVLMGYIGNIFMMGIETFTKKIKGIIDSVICVDLSNDVKEESLLRNSLAKNGMDLIKLVTPTSSDQRIVEIVKNASGFIYSVNVEGISGHKSADLKTVNKQILRVKAKTSLPVVSGFGIKTPQDVFNFAESEAHGIVVGSSIISKIQQCIEDKTPKHKMANIIGEYVKELSKGLSKK